MPTFANRALRRIVASMKVREMRKLVQLRGVSLNATERRLGACYDVTDLRRAAKYLRQILLRPAARFELTP